MKSKISIKLYIIFLIASVSMAFSACSNNQPQYTIDFEEVNIIEYTIACFNEEYTKRFLSIEDGIKGFKGNVFKAKVREAEPNDTWWVSGIKFKNDNTTSEEDFKNISRITFEYKSSVDYSNETQFLVQIIWKDKTNEMEIADVWVDFPIKNTNEKIETFEIFIEDYTKEILLESTNYYLDWIMIGLESGANEDFNEGTFYIDNISFWQE